MNEDHFGGFIVGLLIGFVVMLGVIMSADNPRENQAIEKGYAAVYEGNFHWKDEIEIRNMMKEYEFFKRNLKVPPTSPDIKINEDSPWTKL